MPRFSLSAPLASVPVLRARGAAGAFLLLLLSGTGTVASAQDPAPGDSVRIAPAQGSSTTPGTLPYDHIHLAVPDPAAAFEWYHRNFGGTPLEEGPNRLLFGTTRLMFLRSEDAEPSAGSAIDHFGFSVPDVGTLVDSLSLQEGVRIVSPAREIPGLFELAFVEDPWGTRIEIVEDPELLGFHHVHLRGPDPERIFAWLVGNLGGERTPLKGRIDGVRYRADGVDDVWILVQRGEAVPTAGRAIDHVGWRVDDLEAKLAELEGRGVEVPSGPRSVTLPDDSVLHYSFVTGPAGAKLELVQR